MIGRLEAALRRLPPRLTALPVVRPIARAVWVGAGRPEPAPAWRKAEILRAVARRHGIDMLVETGTFRGDTVAALRPDFARIWSVELQPELHRRAAARFAGDPGVVLLAGDSATVLPAVLPELGGPALFWLDGHWSGGVTARGDRDTPVADELRAVLTAPERHVVLVDDARLFPAEPDGGPYPARSDVEAWVARWRPDADVEVAEDIIRIEPRLPR